MIFYFILFIFLLWTYLAHPTTPFKKVFPPTLLFLPMLRFFFSKFSFFIAIIVTLITNWKNMAITRRYRRCSKKNKELLQLENLSNKRCNIFEKTPKQCMSSTYFFTFKVSLYFQFGIRLMFIFALHVFKVHQCLDSTSMSSMFKRLKLITTIVVKPIIIGMTIGRTVLLERLLVEQCCWPDCCWNNVVVVNIIRTIVLGCKYIFLLGFFLRLFFFSLL